MRYLRFTCVFLLLLSGCSSAGRKHMAYTGTQMEPFPFRSVIALTTMGDSITAGSNASDAAHRWANLVAADMATAEGHPVVLVNNGVAGDNSPLEIRRLAGTERRGVVVIMSGLSEARWNITYTAAMRNIAALADYYDPAADLVVLCTIPHITYGLIGDPGTDAYAHTINDGIRALAARRGYILADVHTEMAHNAALLSGDGIHPNDSGHAVIAACIWKALTPYFHDDTPTNPAPLFPKRPHLVTPHLPIAYADGGGNGNIDEAWEPYQSVIAADPVRPFETTGQSIQCTVSGGFANGRICTRNSDTGKFVAWGHDVPTYIEAWVKADDLTPAVTVRFEIEQYDSAGVIIPASGWTSGDLAADNTGWKRLSTSFTSNAACCSLRIMVEGDGAGNIFYLGLMRGWAMKPMSFVDF